MVTSCQPVEGPEADFRNLAPPKIGQNARNSDNTDWRSEQLSRYTFLERPSKVASFNKPTGLGRLTDSKESYFTYGGEEHGPVDHDIHFRV